MKLTLVEWAVQRDGDLLRAADDVLSNVDEDTPESEFFETIRFYARVHRVPYKLLKLRVLELMDDDS